MTRSNFAIPVYQIVNEEKPHGPKFRSTMWVDELSYTSQSHFHKKKKNLAKRKYLNLL